MFGNLWGWLMSVVIVVFTAAIIIIGGVPGAMTKPTKQLPAALQPVTLATDPNAVLPQGTESGNAGDFYRQAAAAYKQDKRLFTAFLTANKDGKHPEQKIEAAAALEPTLDLLVKARNCKKMDLFASKPEEVVNYEPFDAKPVLPELQQLGTVANGVAANYLAKGNAEMGKQYAEAAFVMGRNLYNERVCFDEYRIGAEAMSNATAALANPNFGAYGKDPTVTGQLSKLGGDIDGYNRKSYTVMKAITRIPAENEADLPYAGDMFDIALHGQDPMWRAEALLKVGRMQYMDKVQAADQKGARRMLEQVAADPSAPKNVRAAAEAGRTLTVEKFRMYGGGG
jgi:hypothetical protein